MTAALRHAWRRLRGRPSYYVVELIRAEPEQP